MSKPTYYVQKDADLTDLKIGRNGIYREENGTVYFTICAMIKGKIYYIKSLWGDVAEPSLKKISDQQLALLILTGKIPPEITGEIHLFEDSKHE